MADQSITILLVEDDLEFRSLLEGMLEDEGYNVLGADSGESALLLAGENHFDLVVTDVKLGGIDGLDTLAELKKGRSELQSLVITGYATEADSIRAISLGVGNYLKKPFKIPDFLRAVADVVQHIHRERAKADYQEAVLATALWGLESLTEQSDAEIGLIRAAEAAERVAKAHGLGSKTARQVRLAVLAAGVKSSDAGEKVPFLLKILPEETTWLLQGIEDESESDSNEQVIARLGLALASQQDDSLSLSADWDDLFKAALDGEAIPEQAKDSDGNLLALAKALEASGDLSGADLVLSQVKESEAGHSTLALLSQARLFLVKGQSEQARAALDTARDGAKELSRRSEIELEGGLLLAEIGDQESAGEWISSAKSGFEELQNLTEVARAELALSAVQKDTAELKAESLQKLLAPGGLESLLRSCNWLFPHLLQLESTAESERALQRLARDLPHRVSNCLESPLDLGLKLRGLELIQTVGTEGYDDFLQDLILNPEQELREKAQEVLMGGDSLRLAPVLRLYSLGNLSTWVGDRRIPDKGWTGRMPSQVLNYIAQHQGQFINQEQLVDVFWDGSLKGGKSLNQTLVTIRNTLRSPDWPEKIDYVSRRGSTIGINPDQPCWHDAIVLRQALRDGKRLFGEEKKAKAAEYFGQAMELDRGDYLEGCYDDWALSFRETLKIELAEGLCCLAEIRLGQSRPADALQTARHILQRSPFSNRGLVCLLNAYIDLGQPVDAIQAFEKVESRMKRELEVEPSIELFKLYQRAKLGL